MARNEDGGPSIGGPLLQPGTLSRGAIAGAVVLLLLGGVAWMRSDDRPDQPLDLYRRMGLTAGPRALERALETEFPPGGPPEPVVRRLEGKGFTCRPAEAGWQCLHEARAEGRQVWLAEVTLGLTEEALTGLAAQFRTETR